MKTAERLMRALRNPRLFARGLNRAYHRRAGLRAENPRGVDVFAEDWDVLVILDACRYDMFEPANQVDGTLSAKESKGSSTTEWLRANVDGYDLRDTVYVTGNPQLERNRSDWDVTFHDVINVWLDDGWDEETGTVLAETMTEAAMDTREQYPHKRLVVHYMQPHYPFVPTSTDFDRGHLDSIGSGGDSPVGENVWNQKFNGTLDVSDEKLWSMYADNLGYALDAVANLLEELSGKTVITSDHGNYVGERASPIPIREYGHPQGVYDDVVVRVPWLEHTTGSRIETYAGEDGASAEAVDSGTVSDRLRDLGYRE